MRHPEKIIQNQIQAALKLCGYLSFAIPNRGFFNKRTGRYNIRGDRFFLPGIPDLCVLLPDCRVLWVECKSPTGKRSPAQVRMAEGLLPKAGHIGNYVLARNVDAVMDWMKAHNYKYAESA